ncbi:serine/threonine-protein kinase [Streptomyces griseorubiginosus]|uniref:serine/threonine-protein kinase n=1 Tax=Streptomyces griseorubiginosus TaxID=67304 RepID=UPI002E80C209|nr:serine/threonine-protein kinase [Streptomyces griseorubiginosus]WUB44875.1 serine/threonine protein kinase [Streptomyces griseorubiginosus]WUB53392.1 serine/threonine protein kinase [Streptomyces griseorubiginosus]
MSSSGGVGHESDETTSYVLQPPRPPQPESGAGRLIAGRYRLLAKLGHGGMGTVWRAQDETVDREVAVKEPRVPDHLPERERGNAFERMRREARAAARLDHPSVVNVHDVAVVDGRPWIVMELVRGRSLGDALQEGTLGAREAARIGLEVLGALEAAHAAGILHRDVKPDNILLGRHDRVVLTDFGIAQIEGETNLTDTGGFVGSPEYIAPERVLGQRPGPASDLWSLGVVLYAATEGVSPFRRSNTPATLQSVLNAMPAPPAAAPGPLADAINGLLQKDPARRPTATQVRALLEATANPPAPEPTEIVRTVEVPAGGGLRLGRKTLLGLGAAVVAAAVAAYLVIADPFAGPLPDGWTKKHTKDVAATLAVPAGYQPTTPDRKTDKTHWITYSDYSGAIWIGLSLDRKAEDTAHDIAGSAAAEMYDDDSRFKESGDYDLSMPDTARTRPEEKTYQGAKAAGNTVTYTTTDSQNPRPRELQIFYYRTTGGDMYKLTVSYPGKGDFTARGREVARTAIANLGVDRL